MKIFDLYQNVLCNVPGDILRYADLRYADLHGADLHGADLQYADLQFADLQFADLHGADLQYADLQYANLQFADLHGADLQFADLQFADLLNTDLQKTILSNAKLKGAFLPYFDETPIVPNIHKAVYEAASAPYALDMSNWHTCATTHHWAGWVVTLAGEAGRALEAKIGTDTAAALIYAKSDPSLEQIPNWYTSNEEALEDMKRLAA